MAPTRILIVEDEAIVAMELEDRLSRMGYEVVGVADESAAALNIMEAERPDAVVMDIRIRGPQDGIETAEKIRARFGIPVVYLTAYADDATLKRAYLTEPYAYLLKPFREHELRAAIEMALYRQDLEKQVREKQRFIEQITSTMPEIVYVVDLKERTNVFVNREMLPTLGYGIDEIREKHLSFQDVVHRDDWPAVAKSSQQIALANDGDVVEVEYRMQHADGSWRWLHARNTVFKRDTDGNVVQMLGVAHDVTERRWAEERLRLGEARYRTIVEDQTELVCRMLPDGTMTYVNQSYLEFFGKTLAETLGSDFDDRDINGQSAMIRASVGMLSLECPTVSFEEYLPIPNGDKRWVQWIDRALFDKDGRMIEIQAVGRDISRRKQAEEKLIRSERQLTEAQSIAQLGSWELDLTTNSLVWSNEVYRMFEHAPEQFGASYEAFLNAIHPDDRQMVDQAFTESVKNKTPYNVIHRLQMADGRIKYVHERCQTYYDPDGRPLRSVGTVQDITERKKTEAALKMLSNAVEQTADAVIITDVNGTIEYVNAAFTIISGFSADEALGQTPRLLKSGSHPPGMYKKIWNTILARRTWHGTFVNRRKTGGPYYADTTITPIQSPEGRITHFVSVQKDVTEQKRRHRETEAMVQISTALRWALTRAELLSVIIDQVLRLSNVNSAALMAHDFRAEEFVTELARGEWRHLTGARTPSLGSTNASILATSQPLLLNDALNDPRARREGLVGHYAVAGVPLVAQNQSIGVLWVGRLAPIDEDDMRLLAAIGDITASAIYRTTLYELEGRRLRESEALAAISRQLNESLDLDRVLKMIAEAAHQLISAVERSVMHRYDEQTKVLRPVAVAGQVELGEPELRLHIGEGIAGLVMVEGRAINVDDTRKDSRYLLLGAATHLRSLLVTPIQSGRRLFGTLSVQSAAPKAFGDDEERLMTMLSLNAAIAIENARLFQLERRRREMAVALQRITQAISSHLDVNKLLQSVVSALAEIADYQFVSLFQVKADGLWLMAQYGYVPDQIPNHVSLEEGFMGKVVRSGQPILVRKATPETSFIQSPPRIRSAIGVPVLVETQVQGLLIVETGIEEPLDIEDLNLLVGVNQQLSIGLENARLYSDLARALEEEKQTQAQLVQAAKLGALGRLTASLAHEINNPLQSVQGCLTLAQEELDDQRRPEKMERYLAVANAEIERISGIVHNMREFYRPAQTDLRATDIHAILQNVVELTSKQLQHNHIAFQRSWADNLPRIEANPDHLKQVFLNLVLNAIDSMPDGGMLTITTASGAIASSNGRPPLPAVRIDVRDTGNGMSPETMSRLFEPFFTTKPSGSGLGLPVSYGIIRAHGGIITVASEERRGSLFTILLPVRQLAQEDTSAADHESSTLPEGA